MVFIIYTKDKNTKKGVCGYMLNDEICKKRDELNKSIENGEEYRIIYRLSVELDELIAKYYSDGTKKETRG